jgi:aspartyl-tRNA(Asn)/glutamyl-tRNA(Gln) amidotransferase subunit A
MHFTSVQTLSHQLQQGAISPVEVLATFAARADQVEPQIHGFLSRFATPVQAPTASESPWAHIPIALKDNICLAGQATTCGSNILAPFVPPYHATVSEKLLAAGIPIVGKANMDEFAMGSSNENSAFGPTRNPWDLERVPGGSSGGSAALVAAGAVPWALGSDTGGSVRQPASFCGIVGMKPTYGRVSRYGLVAYASSLDQIGPLTRTVTDNAILLNLIAGHDARDSTSSPAPLPDFTHLLGQDIRGLRIGIPTEMFGDGLAPEVKQAVDQAIAILHNLGAHIVEVSLPHTRYALAAYYLIATSEASSNLARYDGIRYGFRAEGVQNLEELYVQTRSQGFGSEVKRRIMLGTFALSSGYYEAYYKKAQQVRTLLIQDFEKAFSQCDLMLSPTSPVTAFKLGEKSDPLSMYLTDILTVTVNLVGVPALSVPCGFDSQGLPIGLQLMGKPLDEARLYQVAHAYEQATDWHQQHPHL